MKTKEQAHADLTTGLKFFRRALEDARKEGKPQLAIVALKEDGNKRLVMSFDCDEFFADIALLLNAQSDTPEEEAEAKAVAFLQKHGLNVEE